MDNCAMPAKSKTRLAFISIFVVLSAVYQASGNGGFHNIDEVSLFALTENVAKRGSFDVNQIAWTRWALTPASSIVAFGPEGDAFAKKGPGPSILAIPLYFVGWLLPSLSALQTTLWFNTFVTALTAALLVRTGLALGYRLLTSVFAGLVFGLCTIAWPYAKQFFGEPLIGLALLGTFYSATRFRQTGNLSALIWAGFATGIIISVKVALALVVVPFGFYLLYIALVVRRNPNSTRGIKKQDLPTKLATIAIAYGLPIAFMLLLTALYNWSRFGNPFNTGYDVELGDGFTANWLEGLWGLTASPYKGFFWFTPLAVASIAVWHRFTRRHRAESWLIIAITLTVVGLYAKWWSWWGPLSWGPRFLVPLAPLVVIILLPALDSVDFQSRKGKAFVCLVLLSFVVQVLAVTVNYLSFEAILARIYQSDWYDLVKTGPPALFNPAHSPVLGQFWLLMNDGRTNLDVGWVSGAEVQWQVPILAFAVFGAVSLTWLFKGARVARISVPLSVLLLAVLAVLSAQVYAARPEFGENGRGISVALAEIAIRADPNDGIVTIAPFDYQIPMARFRGRQPIYGYALEQPTLHPETEKVLQRALTRHPRIWLVTDGLEPASAENGVEAWLARNAFKSEDQWFDDARLVTFVSARQMESVALEARFGNQVRLVRANIGRETDAIAVELIWQAETRLSELHGFVQVLSSNGQLIAGQDGVPGGGYLPTANWMPGVWQSDRRGILLPLGLAPGNYTLIVGTYSAQTGERLKTNDGQDHAVLVTFRIP